ncbi:hypothetical protein C7S15_1886 [Burkholderia cepacia]|nr:hypothetical protein [Burkholderia cepacia]
MKADRHVPTAFCNFTVIIAMPALTRPTSFSANEQRANSCF